MCIFYKGCPSLVSEEYHLNSGSFNYGDSVTVSCANGYYFSGKYSGSTSVTLTCQLGGQWSDPDLPVCARKSDLSPFY